MLFDIFYMMILIIAFIIEIPLIIIIYSFLFILHIITICLKYIKYSFIVIIKMFE